MYRCESFMSLIGMRSSLTVVQELFRVQQHNSQTTAQG